MARRPIYGTKLKYEELTPRKQRYIDLYLKSGDKYKSYTDAGYNPSARTLRANAYKLYRELEPVIRAQIDKKIGKGAIMALNIVEELMLDPKQPGSVRYQCAKDYLNRAGYDQPTETKLTIDDLRGVEDQDLKSEIEELIGKAVKPAAEAEKLH